jgi:hypothetical protein
MIPEVTRKMIPEVMTKVDELRTTGLGQNVILMQLARIVVK